MKGTLLVILSIGMCSGWVALQNVASFVRGDEYFFR